MKILSSRQIREADQYTIQHEPVSSLNLMERASRAFTESFIVHYPAPAQVEVFCGQGNNGGDGLAIARMLHRKGYKVSCYILKLKDRGSDDFESNLLRLGHESVPVKDLENEHDLPELGKEVIVIDALFGTGLDRPLEGLAAALVRHLNNSQAQIAAVDVPSGLYTDKPNGRDDVIIKAERTYTFQLPKLAYLLCQNEKYTGKWEVLDIGLSEAYIKEAETPYFLIDEETIKSLLIRRRGCDHKGTFGHALVWAGSYGKMGAAVLCTKAALRAGAGLVSSYIPACGYHIMQISLPEAMCMTGSGEKALEDIPEGLEKHRAIGAGPGIGTDDKTARALEQLLTRYRKPIVLDADALNIISGNKELLKLIPEHSILTPHPKEFERLAGKAEDDWQRLEKARQFAREHQCVLVLKSGYTSMNLPDGNTWFFAGGTPGLATGGTGDVLTGIITGLLAQNYEPRQAALMGVYLQGTAGRLAAQQKSEPAMIAGDVVEMLGEAYKTLLL